MQNKTKRFSYYLIKYCVTPQCITEAITVHIHCCASYWSDMKAAICRSVEWFYITVYISLLLHDWLI